MVLKTLLKSLLAFVVSVLIALCISYIYPVFKFAVCNLVQKSMSMRYSTVKLYGNFALLRFDISKSCNSSFDLIEIARNLTLGCLLDAYFTVYLLVYLRYTIFKSVSWYYSSTYHTFDLPFDTYWYMNLHIGSPKNILSWRLLYN